MQLVVGVVALVVRLLRQWQRVGDDWRGADRLLLRRVHVPGLGRKMPSLPHIVIVWVGVSHTGAAVDLVGMPLFVAMAADFVAVAAFSDGEVIIEVPVVAPDFAAMAAETLPVSEEENPGMVGDFAAMSSVFARAANDNVSVPEAKSPVRIDRGSIMMPIHAGVCSYPVPRSCFTE